jgi:hypothetical protein
MAKIVLSMDGVVLQEMALSKERITIGRRPHNDLVIDNSAISAEHAVIVTMLHDAYLEDLNSTNGTRINGQRIKKQFLKNNDVIELAKYKIRFVRDEETQDAEKAAMNTRRQHRERKFANSIGPAIPQRVHRDGNTVAMMGTGTSRANAVVRILSGPNAGKEIALHKPLTTIGVPGLQLAVVTRRGETYSLTHVEGHTYPQLNDKPLGSSAQELRSGDLIEIAETRMQFVLL